MREALVQVFWADVGAPLQRLDLGDFLLQVGEGRFDLLDILRLGRALELKRYDVLDFFSGDSGRRHARQGGDTQNCGENFHSWFDLDPTTERNGWNSMEQAPDGAGQVFHKAIARCSRNHTTGRPV